MSARIEADIAPVDNNVRFAPESGHVRCTSPCPLWANSGHWRLFNYFIGTLEQRRRHCETEHCRGLHVDNQLELVRLDDR